jgi:hypothetical protein
LSEDTGHESDGSASIHRVAVITYIREVAVNGTMDPTDGAVEDGYLTSLRVQELRELAELAVIRRA